MMSLPSFHKIWNWSGVVGVERITVTVPIVLLLVFLKISFLPLAEKHPFGDADSIIKMCVDFGQNPFFIFF